MTHILQLCSYRQLKIQINYSGRRRRGSVCVCGGGASCVRKSSDAIADAEDVDGRDRLTAFYKPVSVSVSFPNGEHQFLNTHLFCSDVIIH